MFEKIPDEQWVLQWIKHDSSQIGIEACPECGYRSDLALLKGSSVASVVVNSIGEYAILQCPQCLTKFFFELKIELYKVKNGD